MGLQPNSWSRAWVWKPLKTNCLPSNLSGCTNLTSSLFTKSSSERSHPDRSPEIPISDKFREQFFKELRVLNPHKIYMHLSLVAISERCIGQIIAIKCQIECWIWNFTSFLVDLSLPSRIVGSPYWQVSGKVWDSSNNLLPVLQQTILPRKGYAANDHRQQRPVSILPGRYLQIQHRHHILGTSISGDSIFLPTWRTSTWMQSSCNATWRRWRGGDVFPIQIKEDTVEYKADSFKVKPNSMVDIFEKLPGVQVDKNGNVTAQEAGYQVYGWMERFFWRWRANGNPGTARRYYWQGAGDWWLRHQAAVSGIKDGILTRSSSSAQERQEQGSVWTRYCWLRYGWPLYGTINANMFSDRSQLSIFGNANNTNNSLFNIGGNGGGQGGGTRRPEAEASGLAQEPVPWLRLVRTPWGSAIPLAKAAPTRMVLTRPIPLEQTIALISVSKILSTEVIVSRGETAWATPMCPNRIFLKTRLL